MTISFSMKAWGVLLQPPRLPTYTTRAVGAANRARGHRPVGLSRLSRLVADYWRRRPAHLVSD